LLKRLFDFFLFTSLFIAICAVLMVYQTALLFAVKLPWAFYGFVFAGTVCSYNFHWYLTPPQIERATVKVKWNFTNRPIHMGLFISGLLAAGVFAVLLIEHWLYLGMSAFITFLYSAPMINHPITIRLRSIAVGKTIFLAFAWTHVTVILPLLIATDKFEVSQLWFTVNRFFFIYSICIVFDRRDVESDRAAGIKSLITYFTQKGVDRLFWFSILVVILTSLVLLQWLLLLHVIILAIPALLMGLLYNYSKRNSSDYLYYFLLDGLMAFSAAILILANFAR